MSRTVSRVVAALRRLIVSPETGDDDRVLLQRFARDRDEGAFAELVARQRRGPHAGGAMCTAARGTTPPGNPPFAPPAPRPATNGGGACSATASPDAGTPWPAPDWESCSAPPYWPPGPRRRPPGRRR